MYKKFNISLIVTMFFSILIYSNNVVAKVCYEKSPNLVSLHDKYYNVENIKTLSDKEKTKINTLFNKIEGKWEGKLIYTECKGPDRAPRKESKNASIAVNIKLNSNDNLTISANKSYPNKISRHENLELVGELRIFELNFSGDNNLVFSERNLKKNINESSRLIENIYEIKLNGKSLTFTRNYYSNGVFVAEEKWSMN